MNNCKSLLNLLNLLYVKATQSNNQTIKQMLRGEGNLGEFISNKEDHAYSVPNPVIALNNNLVFNWKFTLQNLLQNAKAMLMIDFVVKVLSCGTSCRHNQTCEKSNSCSFYRPHKINYLAQSLLNKCIFLYGISSIKNSLCWIHFLSSVH